MARRKSKTKISEKNQNHSKDHKKQQTNILKTKITQNKTQKRGVGEEVERRGEWEAGGGGRGEELNITTKEKNPYHVKKPRKKNTHPYKTKQT